jgi:hypothetical protein
MHSASHCSFYSALYHKTSPLRNKTILCSGIKLSIYPHQYRTTIFYTYRTIFFSVVELGKKFRKLSNYRYGFSQKVPSAHHCLSKHSESILCHVVCVTESILFVMYGRFCKRVDTLCYVGSVTKYILFVRFCKRVDTLCYM